MNLRRNLSSKGVARQLASRFDDLSRANYEEALFLFTDQEADGQLELPIKIDNTHSHRPRRHSDSFSEDPQIDLFREEKQPAGDSEEHLSQQGSYDPIEELLLPLEQAGSSREVPFQQELARLEQLPENPQPSLLEMVSAEQRLQPCPIDNSEVLQQKKALLKVMNNFQAYNHSLSIAMNFHSLLKKDAVNKMYGSILGVLGKEGRKMEVALLEEIRGVVAEMKMEREVLVERPEKKELGRTMENELGTMVKEEYIE